eukprot:CAMPEP_0197671288 /NCGR_PEP_ID=MMETSP1338-20131121/76387_1 /TAXON_ID=43686 ORGANISM="Pelagodinium beii, Strain RCC1491" /NCGR_SAMPLE_ID=MMETSP1338 /ASSEMBLY_ACC=CAM_ASM_000754 /LENGTH=107 /DNA_ID=CAMNT_0043251153 /DNA_START=129 /DNA_END=449 /DNA_ORIENTATION=+
MTSAVRPEIVASAEDGNDMLPKVKVNNNIRTDPSAGSVPKCCCTVAGTNCDGVQKYLTDAGTTFHSFTDVEKDKVMCCRKQTQECGYDEQSRFQMKATLQPSVGAHL